jgi:hypothetical protein
MVPDIQMLEMTGSKCSAGWNPRGTPIFFVTGRGVQAFTVCCVLTEIICNTVHSPRRERQMMALVLTDQINK